MGHNILDGVVIFVIKTLSLLIMSLNLSIIIVPLVAYKFTMQYEVIIL